MNPIWWMLIMTKWLSFRYLFNFFYLTKSIWRHSHSRGDKLTVFITENRKPWLILILIFLILCLMAILFYSESFLINLPFLKHTNASNTHKLIVRRAVCGGWNIFLSIHNALYEAEIHSICHRRLIKRINNQTNGKWKPKKKGEKERMYTSVCIWHFSVLYFAYCCMNKTQFNICLCCFHGF